MDPKGGNPFLMDDYSEAEVTSLTNNVNPFLQDFTDASAASEVTGSSENPFLSFNVDQTYETTTMDSTNPFASFVVEPCAPVVESTLPLTETPAAAIEEPATCLMDTATTSIQREEEKPEKEQTDHLFGEESSEIFSKPSIITKTPARPPPPPPPPRNTKDLILSVTGEMDAASDHLLNRLQATRTPSPTLMHSPSPTPEHSYADLLDVDTNVPDITSDETRQTNATDILDIFSPPNTLDTTSDNNLSSMPFELTTNTVTTTSGIDYLLSSKVQENPFSESTEDALAQESAQNMARKPSIVNTSPVSETVIPDISSMDSGPVFAAANNLPSERVQQPFEDIPSNYPEPAAQPFTSSDLLADGFGQPAATIFLSTSPTPGAEFPKTDTEPTISSTSGLDTFTLTTKTIESTGDAFDAFASKFDQAAEASQHTASTDPFMDPFSAGGQVAMDTSSDVWGDQIGTTTDGVIGFGETDTFDDFLSMTAPPSDTSVKRTDSAESDEGPDFSVFIKPKEADQMIDTDTGIVPMLAPPPKSPLSLAYTDTSPRFNPFDKTGLAQDAVLPVEGMPPMMTRSDSQETPPTPLFDEDTSQPLEDFPRINYSGEGWEMQLRQPNKKRITSQRFWKKIFVRMVTQGDNPVLQIFNNKGDKDPFQELPLLPSYSVSDICAQQFDQYGKIFTVKLQYIFYKERPGVRPGQVTKAERLTNKLSQFAAYAIQGDYQGVKEFGSDLKKLGLPVEHAPQISELLKLGSTNFEDMKQFSHVIEEALFKLSAHRDRALHYKMEEVQISVVDELYVEQSSEGNVEKQIARVRLFFLGFLSGMPDVELGINDMWRQGKEVVGRHDIIPVVTEEWIRLEKIEFHACVQQDEYEKSRIIKFKPPDACYIELMRFRVRPPKNRELPLQLKAVICVTGNKVELKADILVPGFASRKLGQVPCEDVMIRFPIPECWIYLFRVEKHFRYGSVKSAHRRTGKVKGIERFLGTVDTLTPQLMEVTSGQAKYEHQHHAIVWRMPRLPKEGQGAYTTHQLTCTMHLTSFDQIPDDLEKITEFCYVEFTMPATQVSHTTARSVSFQNSDSDEPPEKYVRNLSRHEYRVGIEHVQGEGPGAYVAATMTKKIPQSTPEHQELAAPTAAESDSDSGDSD